MSETSDLPPRPYIPPLLIAVGVLALIDCVLLDCAWSSFCASGAPGLDLVVLSSCIGASGLLLGAGYCMRARSVYWSKALMVAGVLAFAALCSTALWCKKMGDSLDAFSGAVSRYEFVVVGDSSRSDRGYTCTAEAYEEGVPVARVRLTGDRLMQRGDVFCAVGRRSELGDSDWARSRFMKGESAAVSVVHYREYREGAADSLVLAVRRAVLEHLKPREGSDRALLAGVLCGYGTDLSSDGLRDAFSRTGVSHLVAVSGSHLAVVSACLEAVLRRARAPRRLTLVLTVAILVAFVLFTGASASATRSACMVASGSVALWFGRRRHALSSLALAAGVMLCLNPGLIFDLGFQLSAASVLGIHLFLGYAVFALRALGLPRGVSESLGLTLVAQAATLPITIHVFKQLSLIAPLANILLVPCVSMILALGIVYMVLSPLGPVAAVLYALLSPLARGTVFLVRACAAIPFACLSVGASAPLCAALLLFAVYLYRLWPRPRKRSVLLGAGVVAFACGGWFAYWIWFAPPSITVLDVGQADSILIRDGAHTVLVDAGVDDQVVDALVRNNVFKLDAVVVTHWDKDHWGGLPDILSRYPVGNIVLARGAAASVPGELSAFSDRLLELDVGNRISSGRFSCRVLWPGEEVEGSENGDSVVLLARYESDDGRGLSVLLTGDTEVEQESEYVDAVGDIDVLKLGHHGSAKSVDESIMGALTPELAIASAGAGNSYGHPTEECVSCVEGSGCRFLCTIESGDIALCPADLGFTVRCSKASEAALE